MIDAILAIGFALFMVISVVGMFSDEIIDIIKALRGK